MRTRLKVGLLAAVIACAAFAAAKAQEDKSYLPPKSSQEKSETTIPEDLGSEDGAGEAREACTRSHGEKACRRFIIITERGSPTTGGITASAMPITGPHFPVSCSACSTGNFIQRSACKA